MCRGKWLSLIHIFLVYHALPWYNPLYQVQNARNFCHNQAKRDLILFIYDDIMISLFSQNFFDSKYCRLLRALLFVLHFLYIHINLLWILFLLLVLQPDSLVVGDFKGVEKLYYSCLLYTSLGFLLLQLPGYEERRQGNARLYRAGELQTAMEPPPGQQGKSIQFAFGKCELRHIELRTQQPQFALQSADDDAEYANLIC